MNYYSLANNTTFLVSQKALVWNDDQLLILKSKNDGFGGGVQWELPGGLLELDEPMTAGLKREVREETNLEIEVGQLVVSWDHWVDNFRFNDGRVLNVRIVELAYQCQYVAGQVELSDEHSAYLWCKRSELGSFSFSDNSEMAVTFTLDQT